MNVLSTRSFNAQAGFSLVELGIALTVIGLLLAGIIKGKELVDNARTDRVIIDFQNYQAAIANFYRTYQALPGDMLNPATRLPDCNNAPCDGNGNGNREIGSDSSFEDNAYAGQSEMRAFWVQLARAGLISGIVSNYSGTPNEAGIDFPKTPLGGGYRAYYDAECYNDAACRGNVLRPGGLVGGTGAAAQLVFTAPQAARIDRKIDDGIPSTGRINGVGTAGICQTGGIYPETGATVTRCNIIYRLE